MPRLRNRISLVSSLALATLAMVWGCSDDDDDATPQDFSLRFQAVDGATTVGCGTVLSGFGADGESTVELSDLRFYVSNLRFYDAGGQQVDVDLDENEFQYQSEDGAVALIDLTGTATGACSGEGLSFPEGTARSNGVITGKFTGNEVTRVTFDVGIPQPMMKSVIANNTAEDAPSPLAEMHWSWGFAYRHLVMNFAIHDGEGVAGEGYVHVGSNDCGGDGSKALTDREQCGRINAPAVSLSPFDLDEDVVALDVRELLEGIDLTVSVDETQVPGASCHSSSAQADCAGIFGNLGVTQSTGVSSAASNEVFKVK
jgi:uncharacterized repeat protein (TIGR04052 family)